MSASATAAASKAADAPTAAAAAAASGTAAPPAPHPPAPSYSVVDPGALYARLSSDARFATIRSAVDRTSSVSLRDIDELVAWWRGRKMTLPSWIAPYFLEVESKLTDRDVDEQAAKVRAAGRVPTRSKKSFKICTRLNDPRPSNKHCGGSQEQQLCDSVCRCVICGSDKHGAFQKEAVAAPTEAVAAAAASDERKTDSAAGSDAPPASSTSATLTRTNSSSKAPTRFMCPFQSQYDGEVRELTAAEGWINIKETLAHIGEVTAWRRADLEKNRGPTERPTRTMESRRWAGDARSETRTDREREPARDSATDAPAQPAAADDDSWTTVPVRESRSKKPHLLENTAASESPSKHDRGSSVAATKEGTKESTAAERDRWRREPAATSSAAAASTSAAAASAAPPATTRGAPSASAPSAPWANAPQPSSNPSDAGPTAPPGFAAAAAPAPSPAAVAFLAPSASESRWAGWSSGGAPVTHAAAPAAATGPYFASSALSAPQFPYAASSSAVPPAQWSDSSISHDIAAWSLAATAAPPGRGYVSAPAAVSAAPYDSASQLGSHGFGPRVSNAPLVAARSFVEPAAPSASAAGAFAAPPLSSYSMAGGLFFEQQPPPQQQSLSHPPPFAPSMWSMNGAAGSVPAAAEPLWLQPSPPPASAAPLPSLSSPPRAPVVAVKMASAPYVPAHSKPAAPSASAASAAVAAPKLVMCPVPFANQRLINPRITLADSCIICKKSLADPTHHP